MRLFADTNFLAAAYFKNLEPKRTGIVERLLSRVDVPLLITKPVLLECEAILPRFASNPLSTLEEWDTINADLGTKLILVDSDWNVVEDETRGILQRFAHRASFTVLDVMILASALKADVTHFLSFDTNSNLRALASVLKLKVFPELTADDRRRAAALR